ncbi:MAG: MFS transporter, partial [Dehalococcoidia bacterium]|nr:MFS transporter [Dehalococcoidia bacterium]
FGTDLPTVQWVIVGYALAISVLLLPMGRLGDMVGRKQVYIAGFSIFIVASALAGASPNLGLLIGAKILQGVGSAMIQGNSMAIVISTFAEKERGKALGSHLSVVGTGAVAGPALGGLLVSALHWRWVFFINVPLGLIGIVVALLVLSGGRPTDETEGGGQPGFDWIGAVLSGVALLAFLLVVGNGDRVGWTSWPVVAGTAATVICLAGFIWWELRIESPMLELRLFRRKLVALGVAAGWISFLGTSAARFMMPIYLQEVLHYSPWKVGMFMIPGAFCMVFVGPVAGRLSDRYGWRRFTVGGLALSAVASLVLAAELTPTSPAILVVVMLMLMSIGTGLFNSPNNSSIMSAVERSRYGVISALTQLVRNSANVTSVALSTTIVVVTMGSRGVPPSLDSVSLHPGAFVAGLHWAFLLMGILLVVGTITCVVRGDAPKQAPAESGAEEDAAARHH